MLHLECVVEEHEVLVERRLQSWVTLGDVEGVVVVFDVEEASHAWL